jgi:hypothetical protein
MLKLSDEPLNYLSGRCKKSVAQWRIDDKTFFLKKEKFKILRRSNRVARFYLFQTYQNVANIPNDHTLYQKAKKYTKWL